MSDYTIAIEVIESHYRATFEEKLNSYVGGMEAKGYTCRMQYAPLVKPSGEILYTALVKVVGVA